LKKRHLLPICIELIGITIISTGIGMELAQGGAIYLVLITTGSCLVAVGGIIWGKFMRPRR